MIAWNPERVGMWPRLPPELPPDELTLERAIAYIGEDELVDQVEALPARIKRRSAAKIAPSPNIGGQEGDAPSSPREVEELKAKIRMLEATLHGHDSDDESMRT